MIAFGLGMASVFGLIVGIFSVWNGRMTRREISKLIMEMHRDTTESFRKMDERSIEHSQILKEIQASVQAVQASAERIEETQRYIAELVRIEGEKTRSDR